MRIQADSKYRLRSWLIAVTYSLLVSVAPISAQESQNHTGGNIGLGVSLTNSQYSLPYSILLSYDFSQRICAELIGGFRHVLREISYESKENDLILGLGGFRLQESTRSRRYLGIRGGIQRNQEVGTYDSPTAKKGSNTLFVAPAIGFEYAPMPSFALGLEGFSQFSYTAYFDDDEEDSPKSSRVLVGANLIIRIFW